MGRSVRNNRHKLRTHALPGANKQPCVNWTVGEQRPSVCESGVIFDYCLPVFLLGANRVWFYTFPVCAPGPTSAQVTCALINTEKKLARELRWRHVGEKAGIYTRAFSPSNASYESTYIHQSKSNNFHIFHTRVCDFGLTQWHLYTSWFTRCPGPRISSMTGISLRPVETRDFNHFFCLSYAVNYSALCSELVLTLARVCFLGYIL